jgi:hypothetical protein
MARCRAQEQVSASELLDSGRNPTPGIGMPGRWTPARGLRGLTRSQKVPRSCHSITLGLRFQPAPHAETT